MSEKRIKTPKDSVIVLPDTVLKVLKQANEAELKTLIYYFSNPDSDTAAAAKKTGLTTAETKKAFDFWERAGVFSVVETEEPKKGFADASIYRNYDSEAISKALDSSEDFSLVCSVATDNLQKQLTKNDYSSLLYLYDFVGMPTSVICGIIEDCCSNGKKSMQYIYKKTVGMFEDGIDTYDKFESYLKEREKTRSNIGRMRKLCGMGERALTPKEEKFFERWFSEWKFPFETVKLAYEKNIDSKGNLSFSYMNGILSRWHEEGLTEISEIENKDSTKKTKKNSSFDDDEFIKAALEQGFDD